MSICTDPAASSKTRRCSSCSLPVVTAFLFRNARLVRVAFNLSANVAVTIGPNDDEAADHAVAAVEAAERDPGGPGGRKRRVRDLVGGVYEDQRQILPKLLIAGYMELYRDVLPLEQLEGHSTPERTGVIVGEVLWLKSTPERSATPSVGVMIFPTKGSNDGTFKLVGIFKVADKSARARHWS